MSLFLCFVRAPFKLALLNWMPLDKYWIKKKNRLFPLRRFTYALFIKQWNVCEGVKHPPYCLFTRETRALTDLTSYVAQLALYEPKRDANTAFRACLPRLAHKAPVMQANLYVWGDCAEMDKTKTSVIHGAAQSLSIPVDWLNHTEKWKLKPTWMSHEKHCDVSILEFFY